MRDQYKVLAEKYSEITEANPLVLLYKPTIRKVLNCTTFEQVVETIKASGICENLDHYVINKKVIQVCKEKGIDGNALSPFVKTETYVGHDLYQLIVEVCYAIHLSNFQNPKAAFSQAKAAWDKWSSYYLPFKAAQQTYKAAQKVIKKGSEEAGVNLDI